MSTRIWYGMYMYVYMYVAYSVYGYIRTTSVLDKRERNH